ncbi:MAG: DUF4918 family protein [Flavobacteriales bacterium]|nr:DUF4918 family protein [Flavobacteriales bacterium]MCB0759509.1 DUF4918 family protein [Flavobacteriales bacterium]
MLADRLLKEVFSFDLRKAKLPTGIEVLDPFNGENAEHVRYIVELFHRQYYSDDRPRMLMLGINPGRLGAGSTGICFTDTKRCEADLGIPVEGMRTHEPSSDFFYRAVRAAGGPEAFYSRVYVQAICPLGFTRTGPKGTPLNLNYYDDAALQKAITPVVVQWLKDLIGTGLRTDVMACIGTGKNLAFLQKLNAEHHFFERILPLEHPRFVMQYRYKRLDEFVAKYVEAVSR